MTKAIRHALPLFAALSPYPVRADEPLSPESPLLSRGQVFDEMGGAALFASVWDNALNDKTDTILPRDVLAQNG